ncbi:hypothetical protein T492DRAFT_490795 [Pavlovales sp. CCMP2436]|nr:hypothetical protein T492DRAFT_490795 [Pavlovales sp. CCMP2436]
MEGVREGKLRGEVRRVHALLQSADKKARRDGLKALPDLLAIGGVFELLDAGSATDAAGTPLRWCELVLGASSALADVNKAPGPFCDGFACLVSKAHQRTAPLHDAVADAAHALCEWIGLHAGTARTDAKYAYALRTLLGSLELLLSQAGGLSSTVLGRTRQVALDVAGAVNVLLNPQEEDDSQPRAETQQGALAADRPLRALLAMLAHTPAPLEHHMTAELTGLLVDAICAERPRAADWAEWAWRALVALLVRHGAESFEVALSVGDDILLLKRAKHAWDSADAPLMSAVLTFVRWQLRARSALLMPTPRGLKTLRAHMADSSQRAAAAHGALLVAGLQLFRTSSNERAHARARAFLCFVSESAAAKAAEGGPGDGGAEEGVGRPIKRARSDGGDGGDGGSYAMGGGAGGNGGVGCSRYCWLLH